MSERLHCFKSCIHITSKNIVRPCAAKVYEKNPVCLTFIPTDPNLATLKDLQLEVGMDGLINHQVKVLSGKKVAAIIADGAITFQS